MYSLRTLGIALLVAFSLFPVHLAKSATPQSSPQGISKFDSCLDAASRGNAESQYRLGLMYQFGDGVLTDPDQAFNWYQASALQGNAEAQNKLGWMYQNGQGTSKDPVKAFNWFWAAAVQGNALAQLLLGSMYEDGEGVSKDLVQAFRWYHAAAVQGHLGAQFHIGVMYENGKGVSRDSVKAFNWYWASAVQGDLGAQKRLAVMYESGEGRSKNLFQSARWYRAAAARDPFSQIQLGEIYYTGKGVTKDPVEAAKWYRKAADIGIAKAQASLGVMYALGDGVVKDPVEGIKLLKKAIAQGYTPAELSLGAVYYFGWGVPKDQVEGLAWYNIAAANDSTHNAVRDSAELEIGNAATLAAQQRSKEILASLRSEQTGGVQPANPDNGATSTGSGVEITTDGLILTAAHVVSGATQVDVVTSSGKKSAQIVQVDAANDVALLKCDGHFQPLSVSSSKAVELGQTVFTIGFPNVGLQGISPKLTKGEISSLKGYQDDPREWQISVPVQPGNSGGPLFDEEGNVIGVVQSKLNAVKMANATGDVPENVGYAIKSDYILPLLEPYSASLAPPQKTSGALVDLVPKVEQSVVLILVYGKQ